MHGNLKPTNIFLDVGNSPLLVDFGLAQPLGAESGPYLSPEQTQGGVVDRRSDIYALGVLLFEVFTGSPPPSGVIVSLHSKRPDLPEAVWKRLFSRRWRKTPMHVSKEWMSSVTRLSILCVHRCDRNRLQCLCNNRIKPTRLSSLFCYRLDEKGYQLGGDYSQHYAHCRTLCRCLVLGGRSQRR